MGKAVYAASGHRTPKLPISEEGFTIGPEPPTGILRARMEIHMARSRWLMVGLAAGLVACGEPFLTIPGGELSGVEAEHPGDWAFTDPISTIQVETAPEDPYSINVWAVALDGNLYLHAGASRTTWVQNLEADPRTRVRVEGKLNELAAERVETAEEFARFADAYEAKYDTRPRNENVEEVYVFRLTPRYLLRRADSRPLPVRVTAPGPSFAETGPSGRGLVDRGNGPGERIDAGERDLRRFAPTGVGVRERLCG